MSTIFDYSMAGIQELVESLNQPKFRARQLIQWLYKHGANSYDEMTNLPASLRTQLAEVAPLYAPVVIDKQISIDGTQKYLLQLHDGSLVETVAIPSRDERLDGQSRRLTVCFSTQVGCPMACSFCATGKEGFTRNLTPGEMVSQILVCQDLTGMRVSNVVAMGQGEPFLNYQNVLAALEIMNSKDGLEIGARHITVSTCGIIEGIRLFAQQPNQYTLAISLHCALQKTRDSLMPKCASVPLSKLHDALSYYQEHSGRRITFEYLMISGITDTDEALFALQEYCQGLLAHVNLLKINDIEGSPYKPSSTKTLNAFKQRLEDKGIGTTVRDSRGSDIDGACGQLKNSKMKA